MRCGACGRVNADDVKFCGECGTRLTGRDRVEERKVVSVLFADLVGFTSRSEQLDVEEVRATLAPFHTRLRHVLESHGGTVEKFIGDAVMAVFGAPVAHEDDAERAVRAGLAIRDAIGDLGDDLHVRIGINSGEALVTIGLDSKSEGMVAGDVVNTAARLQAAAPVDGVLVGESTFRSTERQITYATHDPVDAKGKAEPVRCWIANEPRSFVPMAVRESLPLVGRDRESRALIDAFRESRAERRVQLVTVIGVPGIGKSRLVSELASYVEADAELTRWRRGQVMSYGTGVAFFAIAQVVKQECGILDSDDTHVAAAKLEAALVALGLEGVDARWVRNQIGPLIGIGGAEDGSGRSEAFAGWRLLFEAMATESPTVLVLEDVHWADDALLDFVDGLVDRAGDLPLLVVATARPELFERRPGWGRGSGIKTLTIELGPLSAQHTTALIGGIIDRSLLSADVEEALLERAAGNPLYAQEYVRALIERGAGTAPPETVQGIIAARLDGLPSDEKSLLQDAAVIGPTLWLGAVCAVGERDHFDTDEVMLRLERKQLVHRARRSSIAGEVEFSFTHALIRDVAYSQLPRAVRTERHQRCAAWLELGATDRGETVELIAKHLTTALELETALGTDTEELRARTLVSVVAACREAAARFDHSGVIGHANAALELQPSLVDRAEVLARRAAAHSSSGHPDELELLEARDAAIAVGRHEDAIGLLCLLGDWAIYHVGDGVLHEHYNDEALELAADLPPGPVATLPAYIAAYRYWATGQYAETIRFTDAQIDRAVAVDATSAAALMLMWRGSARGELGDLDGLDDLRESARLLVESSHPKAAVALINLGSMLYACGHGDEARDAWESACASARRIGNEDQYLTAAILGLELIAHTADPLHALAELDRAEIGANAWHQHLIAGVRCRVLLDSDPDQSARLALDAVAYARQIEHHGGVLASLGLLARAEHAVGHEKAASNAVDEFLTRWHAQGSALDASEALVDVALVLAACQRHAELVKAVDLVPTATPWRAAARAIAELRYSDAAAILDTIPSIPLRDAARRLEGGCEPA